MWLVLYYDRFSNPDIDADQNIWGVFDFKKKAKKALQDSGYRKIDDDFFIPWNDTDCLDRMMIKYYPSNKVVNPTDYDIQD